VPSFAQSFLFPKGKKEIKRKKEKKNSNIKLSG